MNQVSEYLSVERTQDIWTVRFQPVEHLIFQQLEAVDTIFRLLDEMEAARVKVLRADYPRDALGPDVVDRFWREAAESPLVAGARHEPPLPQIVRTARTSIPRLIVQLRRLTTLCVASVQGEVDFDLLGVVLGSHYRICSDDTLFVNRILDREHGPGSAVFWMLTRYLGFAKANHLLLEGQSLTAEEAFELRLVDRIVPAADLESEARANAERFASKPAAALASLVRASHYLDSELTTYLQRAGTGFGR